MNERRFTPAALRRHDGAAGAQAFVACEGAVYDVSRSLLWRDGRHQVLHAAGADLTAALEHAPHGAEILRRFPVVGRLEGA